MRRSSGSSASPVPPAQFHAATIPSATGRAPGVWREPVPMKPRPGLLRVLLIVLAVWVGLLVAMYVTMVRPRHQRHQIPAGDSSATLYPAAGARPAPVP